jgi:8-oxo-dGTP diphosphatase
MDHEIRRKLLLKLIHAPRLGFNELWNKEGESNLVAYHLRKMEEDGLVAKYPDGYGLTEQGKKESAFIEGDTGGKAELPTPTVVVFVLDEAKGLMLAQERLKEPFFGTWGVVSGKINFGWNPIECAIRDLKEETDLIAHNAELRAIEFMKTYDNGKLMHHHLMYLVVVTEFSGTLKERTHKARHEWMTMDAYTHKPKFPGDWAKDYALTKNASGKFFIFDAERHMENGKFTTGKLNSVQEFVGKK